MSKAHLTAISRAKLSTPAQFLLDNDKLAGRVLDYGCGKGDDVCFLQDRGSDAQGYDPHYLPKVPSGQFDTIMCNFVLNVIEDEDERAFALFRIASLLTPTGTAYISVRNDKRALKGATSKGTWQGFIELELPVEKRTAGYVMYRLDPVK